MIWNSKTTTYYSKGRKAYGIGDELPADVIAQMGEGTLAEYIAKGWIDDGTAADFIRLIEIVFVIGGRLGRFGNPIGVDYLRRQQTVADHSLGLGEIFGMAICPENQGSLDEIPIVNDAQ